MGQEHVIFEIFHLSDEEGLFRKVTNGGDLKSHIGFLWVEFLSGVDFWLPRSRDLFGMVEWVSEKMTSLIDHLTFFFGDGLNHLVKTEE